MFVSFFSSIGFYALIIRLPTFLGIVVSVATFTVGFVFVFLETNLSPKNSTWRSFVGAIMTVNPILLVFVNFVLTPDTYTAY